MKTVHRRNTTRKLKSVLLSNHPVPPRSRKVSVPSTSAINPSVKTLQGKEKGGVRSSEGKKDHPERSSCQSVDMPFEITWSTKPASPGGVVIWTLQPAWYCKIHNHELSKPLRRAVASPSVGCCMICKLGADEDAPDNRASDGRTDVATRESRMDCEMTKTKGKGREGGMCREACTRTVERISGIMDD